MKTNEKGNLVTFSKAFKIRFLARMAIKTKEDSKYKTE